MQDEGAAQAADCASVKQIEFQCFIHPFHVSCPGNRKLIPKNERLLLKCPRRTNIWQRTTGNTVNAALGTAFWIGRPRLLCGWETPEKIDRQLFWHLADNLSLLRAQRALAGRYWRWCGRPALLFARLR